MAGDINSPNYISSRCRALFKAGFNDHEFKITNIKPDAGCVMIEDSLLKNVQKACELQMKEPEIVLNMKDHTVWTINEKSKNIAWVTWGKQGKVSKELANKCNHMQKIIVTSEEDMCSLDMSGVSTEIVIMNEPIDTSVFGQVGGTIDIANVNVEENGLPISTTKKAILLQGKLSDERSIIECLELLCSKYSKDDFTIVLRIYKNTMGMQDDLEMANIVGQIRQKVKSNNGPKITIMTKLLADEELCTLYNTVDLVINTSRLTSLEQITLQPLMSDCSVLTFADSQSLAFAKYLYLFETTQIPCYDGVQCNDLWVNSPNLKTLKDCIDDALTSAKSFEGKEVVMQNCNAKLILEDILS